MSGSDDKPQQLIDDLDKSIATFDELAPSAIDDAVLDTLGQCLIGRSRQLPGCFVPTPFNTPESAA